MRRTAALTSALVMAVACTSLASQGCTFDLPPLVGAGGAGGSHPVGGGGTAGNGTAGGGATGGGTACDARWYDCNADSADGCETDTWTDSNHCGSCARECFDGLCDQGVCQPVVLIAQDQSCVVALDTDWIYSFDSYQRVLQKTPKAGGTPIMLATTPELVNRDLVVDQTHVYFAYSTDDQIMRVSKNGGAIEVISSAEDVARRIALDPTHVYWFNDGAWPKPLRRAPKTVGATAETLVADSGMVTGNVTAVDDAWLYWGSTDTLHRVPKGGGTVESLVADVSVEYQMALDATDVFFFDLDHARIASVAKDGSGGVSELAVSSEVPVFGLGIDDTSVFWISTTVLHKRSKSGAASVTTLVDGLTYGCALAVDVAGDHVYFVDSGMLARVAK